MSRIIDQLVYKITGDNAEFDKSIDKSDEKVGKFGITADKIFAGITVAAIGMSIKKLAELAVESATSLDRVDKLSQKIGISREAFQEWDFILAQSGASVEGLQMGVKTLSDFTQTAANGNKTAMATFDELKVSIYDVNGQVKDQETLFNEVFIALADMEAGTKRTALANDLLGKSATELAPALNTSAEDLEKLRLQAHDLGLVMGDEAVNAGVKFGDNIDSIKKAANALKIEAITPLISAVATITDKFLGQNTASDKLVASTDMLKKSSDELKTVTAALTTDVGNLTAAEKAQLQARQIQLQIDISQALVEQAKAYRDLASTKETNARLDQLAIDRINDHDATLRRQAKSLKMSNSETADLDDVITFLNATVKEGSRDQENLSRVLEDRADLELAIANRTLASAQAEADRMAFVQESAALVAQGTVNLEAYKNVDIDLYNQIMAEANNMKDNMATVAQQAAAGLEQGVADIEQVGSESGEAYLSGVKDAMGIESPSKKMRGIGQFIMEGLRLGLKDGEESISEQYNTFLDSLDDDSKNVAQLISNSISSSFSVFSDLAEVIKEGGNAWDVFAAAGLEAVASVIEGLGQMFAVKAAEAYVLALFGDYTKIPAGIAATAGAVAAYAAAGLVRTMIPSYDVGSISVPETQQATVHSGEMILPAPIAEEARQSGITIEKSGSSGGSTIFMIYLDGKKIAENTVSHINSGGVNTIDARVVK